MRVAVAQIEPKLGDTKHNLEVCLARLGESVARGAELLVLPECAISGYMFDSVEEATPFAEEIPGPSTEALGEACRRLGAYVVCGLLERDGDLLRNAAVFVGPDGLVGSYRKTHLPFLGVDRFVAPGDELSVY
jgi:predicted amidohydrolase